MSFVIADAVTTDPSTIRRQQSTEVELAKFDSAVSGNVPVKYAAMLTTAKATALKKNNVIAQMSLSGVINMVFQVVRAGLVVVLYRIIQTSQVDRPFYFQYDYKPEDDVYSFSTLGVRSIIDGAGRVDYTALNNDASVLTPFDTSSVLSSAARAPMATERHVSAAHADALTDGARLKVYCSKMQNKIDQRN